MKEAGLQQNSQEDQYPVKYILLYQVIPGKAIANAHTVSPVCSAIATQRWTRGSFALLLRGLGWQPYHYVPQL